MRGTPSLIRKINRSNIIGLIQKRGSLSRSEISRISGLSLPSVSRIIDSLIQEGILKEIGKGKSLRGKKPLLIDINSDHQYVFGVEISRKGQIILCNLTGKVLRREQYFPDPSQGPLSIANQLSKKITQLSHSLNLLPNKIAGVGIGTPGFLFKAGPLISQSPFFGWNSINAVEIFEKSFPYPVIVENVAKASAIAEKMYGYGKQFDNFFYIFTDWGVGGGFFTGGALYRGINGNAGEFGHTIIEQNGVPCYCGNLGCLEQYTSTDAIVREARSFNKNIKDFDSVMNAFQLDDSKIIALIKKSGEILGKGVANIINLLNPEAIIIGGEIARKCPIYIQSAIEQARGAVFSLEARKTPVITSQLGEEAVAMGMASEVISRFINGNLPIKREE
jgi:predicted NBD/HSP70 family sugar kinase